MDRTILLAVDGSTFGEQALPLALSVAQIPCDRTRCPRARAILYRQPCAGTIRDEQLRHSERLYLESLLERLQGTGIEIETALLDGPIADALNNEAEAIGASLIVMTTHGRGAFGRFWLGSVADLLVRQTRVPLLLLRPREGAQELTLEPTLQSILIPLDGSPLAEQILGPAVASALRRRLNTHYCA